MSLKYNKLSEELQARIISDRRAGYVNPYRCNDIDVIRRDDTKDKQSLWRPSFVRDTEKIMHLPAYNRYADKTQVFSFCHNDDITRRALHVQLVSRIARNIGAVLGLNLDLIEAIALGHDIGHTPFGHAGERILSGLLERETERAFNHNVHSVRVLDDIYARNLSLQTLDGILCHNGEFALQEYRPRFDKDFTEFDDEVERCYTDPKNTIKKLVPKTLEGCVVRICDMIAYLGKDRQDAIIAGIIEDHSEFSEGNIGKENAAIINNITVDIIEHSYGKDHILMSEDTFNSLKNAKDENYDIIYKNDKVNRKYDEIIQPMLSDIYYKMLDDLVNEDTGSFIYKHHMGSISFTRRFYEKNNSVKYADGEKNQIVVDYIASMTDDYFIALHEHLFPESKHRIEYKSYFE